MNLIRALSLTLALLLGPAACGLKGDLYLPAEEPAVGTTESETQQTTEDEEPRAGSAD